MTTAVPKETEDGSLEADGVEVGLEVGLTLPLMVESLTAVKVGEGKGAQAAYEVTFKAVLPEKLAALLLQEVRDHKVTVRVEGAAGA